MHAMTGPRYAWLYARKCESAPLHAVSMELMPNNGQFWATLLVCPQLLNLNLLRDHFRESTFLRWGLASFQLFDMVDMILFPVEHVQSIFGFSGRPLVFDFWNLRYCEILLGLASRWATQRLIGRFCGDGLPNWAKWLGMGYLSFDVAVQAWCYGYNLPRMLMKLQKRGQLTGNPLTLWWNLGDLVGKLEDEEEEEGEEETQDRKPKAKAKFGRSGSSNLTNLLRK